jgi:hypothetical protein
MQNSHLEKFLHRARRTWTLWTLAEHAGLGLLVGCSCVLLLIPILLWRGQPGQSLAIVFPLLGVASGAMLGLRSRPNLKLIAELADRRFQTADLLATAYALRASADPWHATILNLADARVLALSPASLTPHRLGPRAWSAICLSFVAAITLGLLWVTMPAGRAQAVAVPAIADGSADWERPRDPPASSTTPQSTAAREAKSEATADPQSMGNSAEAAPDTASARRSDPSSRDGQAVTGTGGGSARTDLPDLALPTNHAASAARESVPGVAIATAGQGGEVHPQSSGGATAGQVIASQSADPAPGSAPDWPAAQANAVRAIQAGQVPDAYRNLVRDYFDRSDPKTAQ